MDLQFFPHFVRANYPVISNESNEDLIEIGTNFKKYLEETFKDNQNKLEAIWDISDKTVVMNQVKQIPFLVNGYHPALIVHFGEFIDKMKQKITDENN